jgi:hypothetical protein
MMSLKRQAIPPHPEPQVPVGVDERSFDVEIEPLLSQHGQERDERCIHDGAE